MLPSDRGGTALDGVAETSGVPGVGIRDRVGIATSYPATVAQATHRHSAPLRKRLSAVDHCTGDALFLCDLGHSTLARAGAR